MRGPRGELRHLFAEYGIFAVGAYHALRTRSPSGLGNVNVGYLIAWPLVFVPLAFLLHIVAVFSWSSEFLVIRILFTLPFLICAVLASLGLLAWVSVAVLLIAHVITFARKRHR